ncbi:MAG: hypothetical protein ACE5HE_13040, partial [Phycisphaerae bacterium]
MMAIESGGAGCGFAAPGVRRPLFRAPASLFVALGFLVPGGCTGISVEPSCPEEMVVGESRPLKANEQNEGAMPWYLWEVKPVDAGTIAEA